MEEFFFSPREQRLFSFSFFFRSLPLVDTERLDSKREGKFSIRLACTACLNMKFIYTVGAVLSADVM
jgi:hypothetical protein